MLNMMMRGMNKAINKLGRMASHEMPMRERAVLREVARQTFAGAHDRLSGPGRKKARLTGRSAEHDIFGNITRKRIRKTAKRGQSDDLGARPGSYPVPVQTGHLRRSLGMVMPGATITSGGLAFTAGDDEALVFNSAEYGNVIHEGSEKYDNTPHGPRRFITDSFEEVDVEGISAVEMGGLGK